MEARFAGVAELRRTLIDEIFNAMGLPQGWPRRALWPFAWAPAHRFARLVERFERCNAEYGFSEAARRLLERFISHVVVSGAEQVPSKGPLLIASNHPGAVDAVAIAASLPRQDLKIMVSGVPFFHSLSFIRDHLIYSAQDAHGRMLAVRGAIRHLREGGAVLIFPSGTVDPDPAVFPFAPQSLEAWSSSLALMLNKAPGTRLLVTMVSGVLAPECWRNPLVRLRQSFWEKQKLAEFIQVIQQLVLARRFPLIPRVTFGRPVTLSELCLDEKVEDIMQAIRDNAHRLMEAHRLVANYRSSTGGAAGP
jgi:1-acyl-sn-glycerol-3-phosphate acyltransferase